MELELQSPLTLVPNSFNVLIGPEEVLVDSLNYNIKELQRLQALYVSGNYSRILDKLDRRFTELDIQKASNAILERKLSDLAPALTASPYGADSGWWYLLVDYFKLLIEGMGDGIEVIP